MKTFTLNLRDCILYLIIVFTLALLSSCAHEEIHEATVLENGEHTLVYGSLQKGDTVWVNMDTHEVDNEYADVMQCVITN